MHQDDCNRTNLVSRIERALCGQVCSVSGRHDLAKQNGGVHGLWFIPADITVVTVVADLTDEVDVEVHLPEKCFAKTRDLLV